ncbi:hypothetical protein LCGC14_1972960 [marine sediment metagenome]|uniref:Uncharacterized protein n=1 Tax=marine sediment metagenome TaxID=412755 RepID=A0A0F9HPJ6_9ZZZZ
MLWRVFTLTETASTHDPSLRRSKQSWSLVAVMMSSGVRSGATTEPVINDTRGRTTKSSPSVSRFSWFISRAPGSPPRTTQPVPYSSLMLNRTSPCQRHRPRWSRRPRPRRASTLPCPSRSSRRLRTSRHHGRARRSRRTSRGPRPRTQSSSRRLPPRTLPAFRRGKRRPTTKQVPRLPSFARSVCQVLRLRPVEQVSCVTARRIVAGVQHVGLRGRRRVSTVQLVRYSMRTYCGLYPTIPYLAVTTGSPIANPRPAGVRTARAVNFGPKPRF